MMMMMVVDDDDNDDFIQVHVTIRSVIFIVVYSVFSVQFYIHQSGSGINITHRIITRQKASLRSVSNFAHVNSVKLCNILFMSFSPCSR